MLEGIGGLVILTDHYRILNYITPLVAIVRYFEKKEYCKCIQLILLLTFIPMCHKLLYFVYYHSLKSNTNKYTINIWNSISLACVKSITLTTQIIISLGWWLYAIRNCKTNKTHIKLSHSRHYNANTGYFP